MSREKPLDQMVAEHSEIYLTYVAYEDVEAFTALQKALEAMGGAEGFRNFCGKEVEAKKVKKKGRGNQKSRKMTAEAWLEERLSDFLGQLGLSSAPWRTVRCAPAREATLKAAQMRDLLTANQECVRRATEGRVGYLLVPDTVRLGFAEFHRYFQRESGKEVLIIDLRCRSTSNM